MYSARGERELSKFDHPAKNPALKRTNSSPRFGSNYLSSRYLQIMNWLGTASALEPRGLAHLTKPVALELELTTEPK